MRRYRKPHFYKRKKSILKNRFFWLTILIFIFLFSIFYFLFFSETFRVEKIIATGEEKVSKEDIKAFFPMENIFLVNLDEIRENILDNFPQIAEVEIKRGYPDAINVLVVERLGLAVWCVEEKCFSLDTEGVIFEEISGETDLVKIINKQSGASLNLGEQVIEKEKLTQIVSKITPELKESLKIPIKEFIVASEDKLIALTDEGWEIYLNLEGDIEWQLTKLRAVLEEKIPPERREDLEYIELRFGNFANPKYKD